LNAAAVTTIENTKGLNILVTGASGLMGYPIAVELAKHNKVYGAARFTVPADEKRLRENGVETIQFDGGDADLSKLPKNIDVVYHLGAMVGLVAEKPENRQAAYNTNAYSAARLMSRYRDGKAFIYAASGSAYAYQGERPLREDDLFGFHTGLETYATTKIGGEFIVQALSREWNTPATILRIFSLYSPRGGAVTSRIDLLSAGRSIGLYPGVPNRYCPIYETDYVRKAIRAIGIAKSPPEVVNFCGNNTVTIEDYIGIAAKLLGKEPKFDLSGKLYPIWPDVTRTIALLGEDTVSIEEGVRRVVEAGPTVRLASWASNMPLSTESQPAD